MKTRMIDADKLIDSLRASMNHGRETFPADFIVEAIEEQIIQENNICNKEIHAYQNNDGTYKVEILEDKLFTEIEKADICITVYATKNGNRMISFTEKE